MVNTTVCFPISISLSYFWRHPGLPLFSFQLAAYWTTLLHWRQKPNIPHLRRRSRSPRRRSRSRSRSPPRGYRGISRYDRDRIDLETDLFSKKYLDEENEKLRREIEELKSKTDAVTAGSLDDKFKGVFDEPSSSQCVIFTNFCQVLFHSKIILEGLDFF